MKNMAKAMIYGSADYPSIKGYAAFIPNEKGTLVSVSVYGLPVDGLPESDEKCGNGQGGVFGMHIHAGGSCTGNADDPFADAGSHYNPYSCEHPYHAGDMPPLFADDGEAHIAYITNRFTPREIIGKIIIIHKNPDDMHTQPSGNSGDKIACGEISEM